MDVECTPKWHLNSLPVIYVLLLRFDLQITDEKLSIGASVSMSDVIAVMEDAISKEQYRHLQSAIKHFRRSGNTPVRNVSIWI